MRRIRLLILMMAMGAASGYAVTNVFFARGLAASHAGDFAVAADAFQQSVQQQPAAGALINLGIAEWQRGHAGAAILAWEQAQWIDPFDGQAAQNLKFARMVTQADEPQLKWFETASTWLPPNAWVWTAGASLWLAVGAMILPRIFGLKKPGWLPMVAAFSFGVFLFSLTANVGVVGRTEIGIVLKRNAPLLLTPTQEGEIISTLNAGEPGRRLRARGNFFFISTANGAGWIAAKEFGLINPK